MPRPRHVISACGARRVVIAIAIVVVIGMVVAAATVVVVVAARLYLGVLVHRRVVSLLNVQDLPAQRQYRLRLAPSPLLRRSARRVPLDDEDLRRGGVRRCAVSELPRQHGGAKHALAAHELARRARRLGRLGGGGGLIDDEAEGFWVALKVLGEML